MLIEQGFTSDFFFILQCCFIINIAWCITVLTMLSGVDATKGWNIDANWWADCKSVSFTLAWKYRLKNKIFFNNFSHSIANSSLFPTSMYLDVINCRFPTTETNSKALYISWFSPPHQKLFLVTVQIFVKSADFCLQLCFSERWKKTSRNLSHHFHILISLKMNAHFQKELHFENERTSRKRTTFWNGSVCLEKWNWLIILGQLIWGKYFEATTLLCCNYFRANYFGTNHFGATTFVDYFGVTSRMFQSCFLKFDNFHWCKLENVSFNNTSLLACFIVCLFYKAL